MIDFEQPACITHSLADADFTPLGGERQRVRSGLGEYRLQSGGDSTASFLKLLADVSQGFTAAAITGLIAWAVIGFLRTPPRHSAIVGSSAKLAAAAGGAKEAPITA